mmetsp:Transcript_26766/g.59097  ORF Transcript_26766/g.59097 Transcript_26766/m.59097 type:complete len:160 (+) Transcript_26766:842-1321(+)
MVRMNGLAQFLAAKHLREHLLDLGNSGASADQHNVMDVRVLHLSICQHLLHNFHRLFEQLLVQLLKLRPLHLDAEIFAIDKSLHDNDHTFLCGKRSLGTLSNGAKLPHCLWVVFQIHIVFLLGFSQEVVDQGAVKIFASESRVTPGGQNLEHPVFDVQQ